MINRQLLFIFAYAITILDSKPTHSFKENATESVENIITNSEASASSEFSHEESLTNFTIPKIENITGMGLIQCPGACYCFGNTVTCSQRTLNKFPCDKTLVDDTSYDSVNSFALDTRKVYITSNKVSTIPENCMILSGRNLVTLALRNNSINTISRGAFNGVTQLQHLDLRENNIISLTLSNRSDSSNGTESIFENLRNSLIILQLSYNKIGSIPRKTFWGFQKLEVLSLSYNRISWISTAAFEDLNSIRVLYLRGNPFSPTTLSQLSTILSFFSTPYRRPYSEFSFSKAKYSQCSSSATSLENDIAFRNTRQINGFSNNFLLQSNQMIGTETRNKVLHRETLQTLDLGELGLTNIPGNLPTSLTVLFLDRNSISQLTLYAFKSLTKLEVLQLSRNHIQEILDGSFAFLQKLHLLDLSSNSINRISSNAFCGLKMMKILRLYKNPNLTELPHKVFKHSRSLKRLYLQDCSLQTLPDGPWLYRLTVLSLYGNPLRCDCSTIAPILVAIKYRRVKWEKELLLDPYKVSRLDELDTWPDMREESTSCTVFPYHLQYPVNDMVLKTLGCSGEEWKKIHTNRRMSMGLISFDYQSDSPSSSDVEAWITDESISDDHQLTDMQDKALSTETQLDDDPNDSDFIKEVIRDLSSNATNDYYSTLLGGDYEEVNDIFSSDYSDDYKRLFTDYEGETKTSLIDFQERDIKPTANQTLRNATSYVSNVTEQIETEWLITIAAAVDEVTVIPSNNNDGFSVGYSWNISEHFNTDTLKEITIESENNVTQSGTDKYWRTDDSSNMFAQTQLEVNDDDDEFWELYDEQYYANDVSEHTKTYEQQDESLEKAAYYQNPKLKEFLNFEKDYSYWIDPDSYHELKDSLRELDVYDAYNSYYYEDDSDI